jgi:hypothetical protein
LSGFRAVSTPWPSTPAGEKVIQPEVNGGNVNGSILQLRSNGATCYPLSGGQYLMCGTARDGKAYATVTTLWKPEILEVVEVGNRPRDLKIADLLEHLRQAGETIAEMKVSR